MGHSVQSSYLLTSRVNSWITLGDTPLQGYEGDLIYIAAEQNWPETLISLRYARRADSRERSRILAPAPWGCRILNVLHEMNGEIGYCFYLNSFWKNKRKRGYLKKAYHDLGSWLLTEETKTFWPLWNIRVTYIPRIRHLFSQINHSKSHEIIITQLYFLYSVNFPCILYIFIDSSNLIDR